MDVIDEDSQSLSDFLEVPGMDGGLDDSQEESFNSESTSEISDSETDFAKQLRKQRKQVLEEGGVKKQEDFSKSLRKHREHLVDTWEDHQDIPAAMNGDSEEYFGDLGSASGAEPVVSKDDDVGDFESAFQPTNTDQSSAIDAQFFNTKSSNSGEDDFFDLGSATVERTTISSPSKEDAKDDFGDSGSAPAERTMDGLLSENANGDNADFGSVPTEAAEIVSPTQTGEDGDDSGDLGDPAEKTKNEDLFAAIDQTLSQESNSQQPVLQLTESTEDPFGDFSAPSESVTESVLDEPDVADGFGAFGTATDTPPSEQEQTTDAATSESELVQADDTDNFFGDLGAAPTEPQSQSVDIHNDADGFGAAQSEPQTNGINDGGDIHDTKPTSTSNQEPAMDAFGGFEGVPSDLAEPVQNEADVGGFDAASSDPKDEKLASDVIGEVESSQVGLEQDKMANGDDIGITSQPTPELPARQEQNENSGEASSQQQSRDEFGDLDAAPSEPEKVQITSKDDFGDCGEPLPATRQEKASDGDDFKDFGEASEVTPMEQTPEGDDFGNSAESPSVEQTSDSNDFGEVSATPSVEQTADGVVLGGASEAPPEEQTTDSESLVATQPIQASDADDFGDFGEAAGTSLVGQTTGGASPGTSAIVASDGDDFGDFGEAPAVLEHTTADAFDEAPSATAPIEASDGDDFGDFGAAPTLQQPDTAVDEDDFDVAPSAAQAQHTDSGSNDDFGDFDAAQAQAVPEQTTNGDDFGDFDEAPSATTPIEASAGDDVRDFGESTVVTKHTTDDDDFGDFGEAQSATAPIEASAGDDFGDFDEAPAVAKQTTDGDDFGDFDEAPSVAAPIETSAHDDFGDFGEATALAERTTDDDVDVFGDFGEAPSATAPIETSVGDEFGDFGEAPAVVEQTTDDDDFGDFGEAPSAGASTEPSADDFGDFGTAPTVQQTDTAADDADDFGDFDAAPSAAQAQRSTAGSNDDFGDFDGAQAQAVPSTQLPSLLAIGPELQSAKSFFALMQNKYAFEEVDHDGDDLEPLSSGASLKEFIKIPIQEEAKSNEILGSDSLAVLLQNIRKPKASSSKLIIQNDGRSSYCHFSFPIGGLHAPDDKIETKSGRRASVASSQVPDVLPILLPSGTDMPLDAASPKAKRKASSPTKLPGLPNLGASNGETMVEIPALGSKEKDGSSPAVRQLLSRIPDLRFMLKSTLVLPKK